MQIAVADTLSMFEVFIQAEVAGKSVFEFNRHVKSDEDDLCSGGYGSKTAGLLKE